MGLFGRKAQDQRQQDGLDMAERIGRGAASRDG